MLRRERRALPGASSPHRSKGNSPPATLQAQPELTLRLVRARRPHDGSRQPLRTSPVGRHASPGSGRRIRIPRSEPTDQGARGAAGCGPRHGVPGRRVVRDAAGDAERAAYGRTGGHERPARDAHRRHGPRALHRHGDRFRTLDLPGAPESAGPGRARPAVHAGSCMCERTASRRSTTRPLWTFSPERCRFRSTFSPGSASDGSGGTSVRRLRSGARTPRAFLPTPHEPTGTLSALVPQDGLSAAQRLRHLPQRAWKPAAMNFAMRCLTAAKSSDLHRPPESLSMRPVRASVRSRAPVTK